MNKAEKSLKRLLDPFREFGLLGGLVYGLDRVLAQLPFHARLYNHDYMVQPVSDGRLLPDQFADRYEIREIKRGDPELDQMSLPPAVIEWRLRQPTICLGTFGKGAFIGYIWLCFGDYEEDEVRSTYILTEPQISVFDFDLYIFPKYRMGLSFAGIWDGANQFLYQRGIRFTFSRMTRFNLASAKAHAQLGSKRIGTAIYLCLGGIELMLANISPYFHLSLGTSSRARLKLSSRILLNKSNP